MTDMTKVTVEMPYTLIDELHEAAKQRGMSLGQYIEWACRVSFRLRLVPVLGSVR